MIYTAVFVEMRKHPAYTFVLENFVQNLNEDWQFMLVHGTENREFIDECIANSPILTANKHRLDIFLKLTTANMNITDYNRLMTTRGFIEYIPTEVFLIFQTDTMISSKYARRINDFIKYDYVGAPIPNLGNLVGNGGLSLRRKSKMLEILDTFEYSGCNEDIYFSGFGLFSPKFKINKPPHEKASKFSVESVYRPDSFGVHKPWAYLTPEQLAEKEEHCPGLSKLIELNRL
jgi:hypothetical protein